MVFHMPVGGISLELVLGASVAPTGYAKYANGGIQILSDVLD
jgi:hypothetical protein